MARRLKRTESLDYTRSGNGRPDKVIASDALPNDCICTWVFDPERKAFRLKYMNASCRFFRNHKLGIIA